MHQLTVRLGNNDDFVWAQQTTRDFHYLRRGVDPRARPMVYVLEHDGDRMGLIMIGIPHASKNRRWWGYPGLPTQWQVVDMCRIWIDPDLQKDGRLAYPSIVPGFMDRKGVFRPTVATWFIHQVLTRVQQDRVSLWPPVYLDQPYHIRLVISYHDPAFHRGTIYRLAGAEPMYTEDVEVPGGRVTLRAVPGPSGKHGWVWRLPEPSWSWYEIEIMRPRTLRLPLEA